MPLDIYDLMSGLAKRRPIFHSEADFQFALAWHIHKTLPDCEVRLEFKPFPSERMYLDVWLPTECAAIELKYLTRSLDVVCAGERFVLAEQRAQDIRRYDILKDIQRIESVVSGTRANVGFVITLTNDPLYWQPSNKAYNDAEFRIDEGKTISGNLSWAAKAGKGTTKSREASISLEGSYALHWREYSQLEAERNARFRYLAIPVGS